MILDLFPLLLGGFLNFALVASCSWFRDKIANINKSSPSRGNPARSWPRHKLSRVMAGFCQLQDDNGNNFARSYRTIESGHSEGISELSRQGSYESQTPSYESSHSKNPLTRLLTRSRSSTLGGDKERSKAHDPPSMSEYHAASRGRFTSRKLKWKVGGEKHNDANSYSAENQKLFFMKSAEPSSKLNSAPSIAQFFNRPLVAHGDRDLLRKEQLSKKQLGRTHVTLSSQSSNSLIQDVKLASRFRFNSPESSVVAAPSSIHCNSSSLQGLHRKYLMSADQFILQKWNKSMGLELDASEKSSKHPSYQKLSDEFEDLLEHLERIFKPQERTLRTTMPLEYTVEELARVVYHRIVEPTFDQPKLAKSPSTLEENLMLNPALDDSIDEAKEVRQHEVLHELLQSTKSWLASLKRSWFESLRSTKGTDIDAKLNLVDLWRALAEIWTYFNKFVRFTLMQILIPVQSCIDTAFLKLCGCTSPNHVIESVILVAYKDAVVFPVLAMRKAIYVASSRSSPKKHSPSKLSNSEVQYITGNSSVQERLISCFGILLSYPGAYFGLLKDDSSGRDPVLHEANRWLQEIAV